MLQGKPGTSCVVLQGASGTLTELPTSDGKVANNRTFVVITHVVFSKAVPFLWFWKQTQQDSPSSCMQQLLCGSMHVVEVILAAELHIHC